VLFTVNDLHPFEHFIHFFASLRAGNLHIKQRQFHILINSQFIDQVKALKNKSNTPLSQVRAVSFGVFRNLLFAEKELPAGRIIKKAQDIQQGRFSTSGRPHYGYKFAIGNLHRNFVQCSRFHFICSEDFCQINCFNHSIKF